MIETPIVLDTGPLGMITHPRKSMEIARWFETLLNAGAEVILPEIADYELRRSLIHTGRARSLDRLDDLKRSIRYEPLNTSLMLKAAELWAQLRTRGLATADEHALDGDVILAAQAMQLGGTIATENVKHLGRMVPALAWRDIVP